MHILPHVGPGVNPGAPDRRPYPDSGAGTMKRPRWTARLNRASIDARETGLNARLFRFMLALDECARNAPYCWPCNRTLAAQLNVSEATIQRWSLELETQGGWLCRVLTEGRRPDRIGFLLLRRLSSGLPCCSTVEECYQAAAKLRDNWVKVTNASRAVPFRILGKLPDARARTPEAVETRLCEIPREIAPPAPQNQGARHLKSEASGTSELRPEVLLITNDATNNQQNGVVVSGTGQGNRKPQRALTEAETQAVADVEAAVQKNHPDVAGAMAQVAREEIRAGRVGEDPGQLVRMALDSLGGSSPPALFRSKIQKAAAANGGQLRSRPKPPPPPQVSPEEAERARRRREWAEQRGRARLAPATKGGGH